jgi:thiol-disulfide isomerase/thioredoxin
VKTRHRHLEAALGAAAVLALLTGCSAAGIKPTAAPSVGAGPTIEINASPTVPSWFGVEMTDVNTGKPFRIGDFSGKVVLVETMATWCPTCQGEMSQVKDLIGMYGKGDLVAVALDVDPNEDAALLKKYVDKNGFGWLVAIAPTSVGRFLSEHYDQGYLNPPLLPMLYIDKTGGVWGLPFGAKSAAQIKQALDPFMTP